MRLDDLFEAEIIQFPKQKSKIPRLVRAAEDFLTKQRDIENQVKDELDRALKQSITRQKYLALPTVMRDFVKGIKPVQAWALSIGEIEFQNSDTLSPIQKWIYDKAKELVDVLISEIEKDISEYEDIYALADEAPAPQYPRQSINYHRRDDQDALQIFKDLKKTS